MDTIEAMRAFAAVAQEGGFTAAGRRLGMSTKLVSKYVAALEAKYQAQFLNRTTRSVALTDVGTAYLARCLPLLEEFDELQDLVQDKRQAVRGPIRITAPTNFGSTVLVRALNPFLEAHPEIELDLHLSDTRVAVVEEGFDLAIRIGVPRDSTLVSRKLAPMPLITCASPAYLARRGRPDHPKALATHDCILDRNMSSQTTWRYTWDGEDLLIRVDGRIQANSPAAIGHMAIEGLGIANVPLYGIRAALEEGRLVSLFDGCGMVFDVHALYPPNRHLTVRVRRLLDHLAAWFKA